MKLAIFPPKRENRESLLPGPGAMMDENSRKKMKIGEALIQIGAMTEAQVNQVLTVQRERYHFDKRFGEIAVELQLVDQETIEKILAGEDSAAI
jgi:hypothetical protein